MLEAFLWLAFPAAAGSAEADAERARALMEGASRLPVERVVEGAQQVEIGRRLVVVRYPDGTARYMSSDATPIGSANAATAEPTTPVEDHKEAPWCRPVSQERFELLWSFICVQTSASDPDPAELDRAVEEYVALFAAYPESAFSPWTLAAFGGRYRRLVEERVAPVAPAEAVEFFRRYISGVHSPPETPAKLYRRPSGGELTSAAAELLRLCAFGDCPRFSDGRLDTLLAAELYRADPEGFERLWEEMKVAVVIYNDFGGEYVPASPEQRVGLLEQVRTAASSPSSAIRRRPR